MGITDYQFNNALKYMANLNTSIELEKDELYINLKDREGSISRQAVNTLTDLVALHQGQIKTGHLDHLERLKGRLLKAAAGDSTLEVKIQKTFEALQTKKENHSEENFSLRLVCEVSAPPTDLTGLLYNLNLVVNNPKLVLTESLSVVDLSTGQLPTGWSRKKVYEKLKQQIETIQKNNPVESDAIREALQLYKPMHSACLNIVMHPGPKADPVCMGNHLNDSLLQGLPTLSTCVQIQGMSEDDPFIKKLKEKNYTIYLQREGGFALLIPPSCSLLEAGINPNAFELWSKPIKEISLKNLDAAKDLDAAILTDQENQNVRLMVHWVGHGLNSTPNDPESHIGGLPNNEFQKTFNVLTNKGMDFLWLNTCFAGGENMAQVGTTSGIVSCPVIAESSMDLPTLYAPKKTAALLNAAAIKLYSLEENPHPKPKQLTQTDMAEIGEIGTGPAFYNEKTKTLNLQSFVFQTPKEDIPHALYLGYTPEAMMDVDEVIKHQQKESGTLIKNPQIDDVKKDRQYYFFSIPMNPSTISNSETRNPVALLSRGGTNFHIVKSMSLPHVKFEDIVNHTIEARIDSIAGKAYAPNKLFALGILHCTLKGIQVELKNVVIAAAREKTLIAFKTDTTPFQYLMYNSTLAGALDDTTQNKYSKEEFCAAFYPMALACKPSKEQLRLTAGGRQGTEEFFDYFQELFWDQPIPAAAKLCQLATKENTISSMWENTLQELSKENSVDRQRALNAALATAVSADNPTVIEKLIIAGANINAVNFFGTPLGMSVRAHNLKMMEHLLNCGASLNQGNAEGLTPLHEAVLIGKPKMIALLLDRGADPCIKGGKDQQTAIEMAANNSNLFSSIIEKIPIEKWNQPFSNGWRPLFHAIHRNNLQLVTLLTQYPLLLSEKNNKNLSPLQYAITDESISAEIKKILSEADCDLELTPDLKEDLMDELNDHLNYFYRMVKGSNLSLDTFRNKIEASIAKLGQRGSSTEAIEYFLTKGCKYPIDDAVKDQGVESDLASNAAKEKLNTVYLKILGGWEFDPFHAKMQLVLFHALNKKDEKLLDLLVKRGVPKNPELWVDSSWQQANQISESDVLNVVQHTNPQLIHKISRSVLKEQILEDLKQEKFKLLDIVLTQFGIEKSTALLWMKKELGVSTSEFSDVFIRYAGLKRTQELFQMGFELDEASWKNVLENAIVAHGNPEFIDELEKNGVQVDKSVLENVFKIASKNPSNYPSLITFILDKGVSLDEKESQNLILRALDLGLHDLILQLQGRGLTLAIDNEHLFKLFEKHLPEIKKQGGGELEKRIENSVAERTLEKFFPFLLAATMAGVNLTKFPNEAQTRIREITLDWKLNARPEYKMFAKKLHWDALLAAPNRT